MSGSRHISPTGELESSLKGLGPPAQVAASASPGIRRRTMSNATNTSAKAKKVNDKTFAHLKRLVHDGASDFSSDGGTPSRSPSIGSRRKTKKGNLSKSLAWLSKFDNVMEAFGKDIRNAQKAVWLGSSLIPGRPSDKAAWETVRDVLRQDLTEAEKVFVALSDDCIGVVEAKPKKGENPRILQKELPENVTLVLSEQDSTDGLLLAFVTENPFLRYNSIHVFGMKRVADGQDLSDCMRAICGLEVDQTGRRMSKVSNPGTSNRHSVISDILGPPGSPTVSDGSERIFTVQYLGSANVSSDAWWKRVGATVSFEAGVIYGQRGARLKPQHQLNSVRDVYCEPFRNPESIVHQHFASEVVFSVSADRVSVFSCNTQELITTTYTQSITLVKKVALPDDIIELVEPSWAGSVDEDEKTSKADADKAGRLLTDEQRALVMEKVRDGDISVDEAIAVVLKAETDIRRAERGQILCITYCDHELDSTHIIALLSKGGRALDAILEALSKARKNAKLKETDPFEPLEPGVFRPQKLVPLQEAELDRNTLTAIEHVGNGEFGEVYLANHVVDHNQVQGELVEVEERRAVKTLKPKLPDHCARTFTREALVHLDFKHDNIVKCLGVCMTQQPFLVVLEYCMYGDLRKVLVACQDRELEVRATEFMSFGKQIADALAYLTAKRIVHMDIATRNILVGTGSTLKVADFGLAQSYNKGANSWTLKGKLRLPFLWVPPECLPEKLWNPSKTEYEPQFNEQTDMWSFGVLLWEMFTYGGTPYGFTEKLLPVLVKVFNGTRLTCPENAPALCDDIMEQCFRPNGERPTFAAVEKQLHEAVDASTEGIRDIGRLLNAPLEEHIEKLSKEVSLQRQASVAVLRQKSGINLGASLPATITENVTDDQAPPRSRQATTQENDEGDVDEDGLPAPSRSSSSGSPPATPTPLTRRLSQRFFDATQWELNEAGKLIRSPHPTRSTSGDDAPTPVPITFEDEDEVSEVIEDDSGPNGATSLEGDVLKTFSVAKTRRRLSSSKIEEANGHESSDDEASGAMSPLSEGMTSPTLMVTEDSPEASVIANLESGAPASGASGPSDEDVGYIQLEELPPEAQNPFGDDSDDDDVDVDTALENLKR